MKTDEEYERLQRSLDKVLKLFKSHLDTMSVINQSEGYIFTQPLIQTSQSLRQIVETEIVTRPKGELLQ